MSYYDDDKPTFGKKLRKAILIGVISLLTIAVFAYCIVSVIKYKTIVFNPEIFVDGTFSLIMVISTLLLIVFFLTRFMNKQERATYSAKVRNKGGIKKFYDSEWVSSKELKTNPVYKFHYYSDLHNSKDIGIPIRAQIVGGQLLVNMYKSIHTLVVGTTGSGKTTQYIDPTIQILSESGAKPCLVITDPKGELYNNHSEKLRKRGYRIIVLDLKEPFKSTCWNPMTRAYDLNKKAHNLEKELKIHRGDSPKQYPNLKQINNNYSDEWYEFNGLAFNDINLAKTQMESVRQQLETDAMEDLKDIAATLCPIDSTTDPIWERGAKDFVLGTMLAMLEDSNDPKLGMTREKFNFYNLAKITNLKDNDPYNPTKTLDDYFAGRSKLSKAVQLANQVITNAETTKKSYMGIVSDRMGIFGDMGVCYITNVNEMNLEDFASQPTALFIKIPDEKITRHPIATMFISQLYKILVDSANKNGGSLPRKVYFVLDEFANIPAIQNFDTIITVARSREIYFIMAVQSYSQLTIKYKEDVAETIKDNCNIHIYIASNDDATKEAFSKRCGTITIETESISTTKNKSDTSSYSNSTNVSIDSRPLIYPNELNSLNEEMIISILKQQPIRTVFTPSYKARKFYDMTPAKEEFIMPKVLDEQKTYYDIKQRNEIVLNKKSEKPEKNDLDDFDFGDFNI